jgi:hypothetical protein
MSDPIKLMVDETLKRKPNAKYADFTAGNRVMWRYRNHDSSLVIFFDKEPNLLRGPDVLCEWKKIPDYFPPDFFKWGFFDPPHSWFGMNSIHNNPKSYDEDGHYTGMWWGNGISREILIRDIVAGQRALSRVTPLLLFKWNETSIPLHNILSCFTEFREEKRMRVESNMKRGSSETYWCKMVRR